MVGPVSVDFPGKQDVLRYALIATAPETKDNDFTWRDFQNRNNSELVAILGNFVNRVMVLTHKYYGGEVPSSQHLNEADREVLDQMRKYPSILGDSIEKYRFREALSEMMNLARLGNKYLADNEPWKTQKTDPERTEAVMYTAVQIAGALATLCEPFLPFAAASLAKMLDIRPLTWDEVAQAQQIVPSGHRLGQPALLFEKIEDAAIEAQLKRLEDSRLANIARRESGRTAKGDHFLRRVRPDGYPCGHHCRG